ncbi:MAG: hypothetical protein VYC60_00880 [Candidatus Thermoplasmatota archaeon]|nr:hypothetical protein [Candidatus Thermoplasmatota archaeon]
MRDITVAVCISLILLSTPVSAHEPKEYTMLLKEDGVTPNGVPSGILVTTDSLFFRNVDNRENTSHRILIDVDGDGEFDGIDDISTAWLTSSCELNETGQRIDSECEVTALVYLDPSNGLLPGILDLMHQIDNNGLVSESNFTVTFSDDEHIGTETPGPEEEDEAETSGETETATLLLIASLLGIILILPRLTGTSEQE